MHTALCTLALLALASFSSPALAIYKCEAGGKTIYSDVPCHGDTGKAKEIDIAAPAPNSDDAQRRAQQEKKELQRLESERRKQEASDEKALQRTRKMHEARKKKCGELALRLKWAREDAQQAAGKSREKALKNLRRAEDKYGLSCHARS